MKFDIIFPIDYLLNTQMIKTNKMNITSAIQILSSSVVCNSVVEQTYRVCKTDGSTLNVAFKVLTVLQSLLDT